MAPHPICIPSRDMSLGETPLPRLLLLFVMIAASCCCLVSQTQAQETIGGGTLANPAVGPAPSFGIGGASAVLVKNWNFGSNGTIRNISEMSGEFFYHDQYGTITNGNNYGAKTVAPDAANAIAGQPVEGVDCPAVRSFFPDSLQTYLQPLNGATTVNPTQHNAGSGSFMAKWKLPYGGSWLGDDIVWETRVRYVTPPYFWFAIWTAGNRWDKGAEHDLVESFGYDNGGGNTNYDGRYWHSNAVPAATDAINYSSWSSGMAAAGITNWDPTVYHTWTLHYKADNTYAFYMDGVRVQYGTAPYGWTLGADLANQTVDLDFLFDGGWGHTAVASVNHAMPASNFAGKFYEWDYSRVYLVPLATVSPAPTGLIVIPDQSTQAVVRWNIAPNASSYNVYRGTSPGGESATPVATGLKSLSFIDTGLTNGVTYYYKVAGVNSVGTSALSGEASVIPVVTYTVDDVDADAQGWNTSMSTPGYYGARYLHDNKTATTVLKKAIFTPTLPASGNYEVYMRVPAGSNRASNVPVDVNHAGGRTTVSVDERFNSNIWVSLGNYFFNAGTVGNVTIRNDGANNFVMADVVRWIPTAPVPPATPANLTATPGNTQITLAWTASGGATSYSIYRGATAGGESPTPLATSITTTSYTDVGLTNGTTYYYKVAAVNASGTSAFSNEASAAPSTISTIVLSPVADAYVQDGTATNFGASTTLRVKGSTVGSGFNRQSYLKFDLTAITGTITSAQLNVYGSLSAADTVPLSAYSVADTSWSETGIIFSNKPAMSATALFTRSVTNTAAQTLNWDVSSYVASKAGSVVSFGLNAPSTTIGALFTGNSREAGTNPPQLVVQVAMPVPPPQSEYIVDNPQATMTGTWSVSSHLLDRYGADYFHKTAGSGTATVKWTPNLGAAGNYAVYYWLPGGVSDRPTNADFKIFHSGGSTSYSVDETAVGGKWILLGIHAFATGMNGYVILSDLAPAGKIVIADAIKFVIQSEPVAATVTLSDLAQTYNGTPRTVTPATQPTGLNVALTYGGASTAPTEAGSYPVVATVTSPGYSGSAAGTLTIDPAPASMTLANLTRTYDGTPRTVTADTSPAGLAVAVTYDGNSIAPANAGSYLVAATVSDPNYVGSANGTLTIEKAPAGLTLANLSATYDGAPHAVNVSTLPDGLAVSLMYDGGATAPTNAGTYSVAATINDANYVGSANGTLSIAQAAASVGLTPLIQFYDGSPKSVTATTQPAGLNVAITYNGGTAAPTWPGSYAIGATISEANYSGSANDTLAIATTALVRHAPKLNGDIDGSVQVLLPETTTLAEDTTLNFNATVSGDLLVPGTPAVQLNGHPVYGSTIDGPGSVSPSNYSVVLNGNALLRHVVRRTNAVTLPVVAAPSAPVGTRTVVLDNASQSAGDFTTLRNLTLNGSVGPVAIPPGVYGTFVANDGNSFVLGVPGGVDPAMYQFQALTMNGGSRLEIVGPVFLTLAGSTVFNAPAGAPEHPEWLTLAVAVGGVTLSGGVAFHGHIVAPSSTVTLNGSAEVNGSVQSDGLVVNGGALLRQPTQP